MLQKYCISLILPTHKKQLFVEFHVNGKVVLTPPPRRSQFEGWKLFAEVVLTRW